MVEAGPGSIITCNPGEVHDGRPIGDSRAWRMLYLAPGFVATILADIRDGATADFEFTRPVIENQAQVRAFELAYATTTGACADAERAQERLILLLAGMLHKKPPPPPSASALARAKARIDEDPAAPITLAALARDADLSRFQVVRGFAKLTGLTPHSYIVQRRLDAARTMIADGAALANAAVACGFSDQSHFNRMFVRRYGVTPGAYAEAMR